MENLGKDVLSLLALELAYPDILKLCNTSKNINRAICENEDFWRSKLYKTYPKMRGTKSDNYRQLYKNIQEKVKELLNSKEVKEETGFGKAIYMNEELVNFFTYANFGFLPGTEIPLNCLLTPLLERRVLSPSLITILFGIYLKVNNLSFFEDGKKYYQVGPDMDKYLNKYLDLVEASDRARPDEDFLYKPRFDRNKFVWNRQASIINKGIIPELSLSQREKEELQNPQLLSLLSKTRQVIEDML